jgi:hypothetical protein
VLETGGGFVAAGPPKPLPQVYGGHLRADDILGAAPKVIANIDRDNSPDNIAAQQALDARVAKERQWQELAQQSNLRLYGARGGQYYADVVAHQKRVQLDQQIVQVQEEEARKVFFAPTNKGSITANLSYPYYGKASLKILKGPSPTTYGQIALPDPVDAQKARDYPYLEKQFKQAWLESGGKHSHALASAKRALTELAIEEIQVLIDGDHTPFNPLYSGERLYYTHKIELSLAAAKKDQDGYLSALAHLFLINERNKQIILRSYGSQLVMPQEQAAFALQYIRMAL